MSFAQITCLQKQHKLYLIFCVSNFFKVGKFAAFSKRPKAKSVLASGGFAPCPLTRGSAPDSHYRGLTLVFGEGVQL